MGGVRAHRYPSGAGAEHPHAHGGSPSACGTPHETCIQRSVSNRRRIRRKPILAANFGPLCQLHDTTSVINPTQEPLSATRAAKPTTAPTQIRDLPGAPSSRSRSVANAANSASRPANSGGRCPHPRPTGSTHCRGQFRRLVQSSGLVSTKRSMISPSMASTNTSPRCVGEASLL